MASKKTTKVAPSLSRFTDEESARYSAIQSLAIKYFGDKGDIEWIACVRRATEEVDRATKER